MESKGLRIEHDWNGGPMRAGGMVNPRDRNFRCPNGWFSFDHGVEIRLVLDGDVERFRGAKGVIVLDDDEAIDAAVLAIQPTEPTYAITSEPLLIEYIRQAGVDITDLGPDMSPLDVARSLHAKGCAGVSCTHPGKPMTCCEFRERLANYEASKAADPKRGREATRLRSSSSE